MKITISELETYEIKIPETIDPAQLYGVISKLNLIAKLCSKEQALMPSDDSSQKKNTRVSKGKNWTFDKMTREEAVNAARYYYLNGTHDFQAKYNLDNKVQASYYARKLTAKYNISANEVGIKFYPKRGEKVEQI